MRKLLAAIRAGDGAPAVLIQNLTVVNSRIKMKYPFHPVNYVANKLSCGDLCNYRVNFLRNVMEM